MPGKRRTRQNVNDDAYRISRQERLPIQSHVCIMADMGAVHERIGAETLQLAEDILAAIDEESARCHVLIAECHTILSMMEEPDGGGYLIRPILVAVRPDMIWCD